MKLTLMPGHLALADLKKLMEESTTIELDSGCHEQIHASERTIFNVIAQEKTIYGVNTGFGKLAHTKIETKDLELLQKRLVLSHATGTGPLLTDDVVRLILALKINSLARGYSGVRIQTIDALISLYNAKVYPCIPSKGSVGASGDLAPLAHLAAILLNEGEARYQGTIISAKDALAKAGLKPLHLAAKEGLALLNGTQVSTALALKGLFDAENNFIAAIAAGALSTDAARASIQPFDARIQQVRGHESQIHVAHWLRTLLSDSEILFSHHDCEKIQDPYSIRCQPQVMGACLAHIQYVSDTLLTEANAVSDNPLVFADDNEIVSGGNFHAEPVALVADALAVSIAEIGAISERRTALLVDPNFSRLPAFLVNNPGINSGFMIAQVTSAALASENKSLAHPASVDSLPTSANQEDHVSMATFAARRLTDMNDNTCGIVAIELLAAAQGIDFLRPMETSPQLEKLYELIRQHVTFYEEDRFFAPDIEKAKNIIHNGDVARILNLSIF